MLLQFVIMDYKFISISVSDGVNTVILVMIIMHDFDMNTRGEKHKPMGACTKLLNILFF